MSRRLLERAARTARPVFGYEQLRPAQGEVIASVLGGRDTLAILPTGGKSAIHQTAAVLLDGPRVVVSPPVALQGDPVEHLGQVAEPVGRAAVLALTATPPVRDELVGTTTTPPSWCSSTTLGTKPLRSRSSASAAC